MSQILKDLLSQHGDELINGLSSFLNVDKAQAEDLVNKGVPVVMSGLRQQHRQVEGGSDLLSEIGSALGGGALLGQLGGLFGAGGLATNPAAMNQFLGGSTEKMAAAIAKKTGLSQSMVQQALVFLIPIVISALFKFGQEAKAGQPREAAPAGDAPQQNDALGGIINILDRDGDGSILDDILEMAGGSGGGASDSGTQEPPRQSGSGPRIRRAGSEGGAQSSGGGLAGILRAIFGGRN